MVHPTIATIAGGPRTYGKGNIVYFQGEAPRSAFVVNEGTVQAYAIDDEGDMYIVGFFTDGDVFPIDWLYDQSTATTFYFEALTPAILSPIEKSAFQAARSKELDDHLVQQLIRESTSGQIRNLALQQARARDKIIYFFYFLAIRHGKELASGLFSLGIPLTHQTIANCLGLTRETVATELGTLKRAGTVAYRNKKYVVDKRMVIKAVGKEISL